ncbi:kinase [Colletotrichum higginsianum]|uniref:non-specific serine/threonine protein kinase n=1 Tax=Colletotrichum higginsianum (strain IMI 349063) TaxID=759273 RepID=H1W3P9_COLHI|nr:kinase [Colletotrichum higginsianum]
MHPRGLRYPVIQPVTNHPLGPQPALIPHDLGPLHLPVRESFQEQLIWNHISDKQRVITAERAAAAKIYLETYYREVLSEGPTPRESWITWRHFKFSEKVVLELSSSSETILAGRIVSLISSFHDPTNLYLLMDYMPGGDFLGLLIRENTLTEERTRFYIAEMIICVEEAHKLGCIHRDVKPDNFLIGADGHLKISDFGLAFDNHWSHNTSYYKWHRQGLLSLMGVRLDGDREDRRAARGGGHSRRRSSQAESSKHTPPSDIVQSGALFVPPTVPGMPESEPPMVDTLLEWRNAATSRSYARSVVGTSQYMAPEVVTGENYDGRCD